MGGSSNRFDKRFRSREAALLDSESTCSVCARSFEVRFRYQVREEEGRFLYSCSQACLQQAMRPQCRVCGTAFELEYPFQAEVGDGGVSVLRSVKAAIDPDGLFNPGVLIP